MTHAHRRFVLLIVAEIYFLLILFVVRFGIQFQNPQLQNTLESIGWGWFAYMAFVLWKIEFSPRWIQIILASIFSLLAAGTILPILLGFFLYPQEVERYQVGDSYLVVYLTNGGATTDFGVILQWEKKLPFGLKQVVFVDSGYHMSDSNVDFERIGENKLKITKYGRTIGATNIQDLHYVTGTKYKVGDILSPPF